MYCLQYSDAFAGDLFMATNNLSLYYSLENALDDLFLHARLNYQHCLLTVDCNTVAIFKTSEGNFNIFYSHSRDSYDTHLENDTHLEKVTHLENVCKLLLKI